MLIGGNCGVYERRYYQRKSCAWLRYYYYCFYSVYDLVNKTIIRKEVGKPIEIPKQAVVVAGSRAIKGDFAAEHSLSIYCPIIIKYRDEKTDARTALEDTLR